MNLSNIKDTLTTIAGILGALAVAGTGLLVTLAQYNIPVPNIYIILISVVGVLSTAILGYFNGKNPDGSSKTPDQISKQLNP